MNKRYFFISALLFLPSYGFWWASNYINYGAEGILINGFVRLLEGLPYVSKAGEVPVVLSTYFPGFYLLYYPFAKILEINTPQNIAYLVRTLMPFYYGISIILIIRFVRENFNSKFDYKIFLLGFGFFVFKEFEGIFVFKPDMVSVFLEIFGLLFGLRGLRNKRSKDFCWSGFIFALAAIIKLNTVGMGIGFAIALLSLGYWSQFLLFSTVGLVTLTAGVGGTALYLGWDIFISVLEVTRTDLIQTQHFGAALNRVLLLVGFPYALVGLLSILATEQSEVWEKTEKRAIHCSLAVSLLLATIGQFKYGAYINYYYSFLIVVIILASTLNADQLGPKLRKSIFVFLGVFLSLCYVFSLERPGRIFFNDLKNYDFVGLVQFLDTNVPNANIYVENNNAATHLSHRAWTGVSFLVFLRSNRFVDKKTEEYRDILFKDGGVNTVVSIGSGCETPKFDERFSKELGNLKGPIYKKGKICVFGLLAPMTDSSLDQNE